MKSVKKKGRQRRRVALWVFLALLILLIGLLGYGAINASTLYVRRAEVYVPDLPSSFEGLKLLYVSDIDICGINTAERAAEAINRLQELKPDVLIFGGDYTSSSLLQLLNRTQDAEDSRDTSSVCEEFFSAIREFPAPLGRIAIVSPEDDAAALEPVMRESGFQPLINASIGLSNGSDRLWFVGICDDQPSTIAGMNHFQKNDCVVCVTYGPSCFPQMMTLEASDSGPWVDLALAGHTHGGQIRFFGRSAFTLAQQEQKFLSGWNRETGIPMLTTTGLGCEACNLRLGSHAEAWLIVLTNHEPDLSA